MLRASIILLFFGGSSGVELISQTNLSEAELVFRSFRQRYQREYEQGTKEYATRLAIFSNKLEEIRAQNSRPDRLWTAGTNSLSDRTELELSQLRGWSGTATPSSAARMPVSVPSPRRVNLLQLVGNASPLPRQYNKWTQLGSLSQAKHQRHCGSCWAVAAATVLEAHSEIHAAPRSFSIQELVNCVPNPFHCGGSGGCHGATAELAFNYVIRHGLATEEDVPYKAKTGHCRRHQSSLMSTQEEEDSLTSAQEEEDSLMFLQEEEDSSMSTQEEEDSLMSMQEEEDSPMLTEEEEDSLMLTQEEEEQHDDDDDEDDGKDDDDDDDDDDNNDDFNDDHNDDADDKHDKDDKDDFEDIGVAGVHLARSSSDAGTAFGMQAWEKLPENAYEPLLRALYERGPVAVSVTATPWHTYESGIFNSCDRNAVINHAVVLVGYGETSDLKFWTVQNSWGPDWGEDGRIRVLRHESSDASQHCGWDHHPEKGTTCENGPKKVRVCGMCGILYDSVVPHFSHVREVA